MGTGYTRNDIVNNIADGNVINASDLDGEFDAVQAAFNESTGHTHDGTSAEGAPVTTVGPAQDVNVGTSAVTPKTDNTVDLGSNSLEFKDLYIDGTANIDALVADTADINAGTIDATVIGGSTPAAATVTTLTVNGNTTLGDAATDTVTFTADVASNIIPSADNTHDLGASGSEWKDLYIDGTANIDSLVADTADINAGTIDGVTIGGAAPGVGTFTTANATTVDATNIEVTNIKAKDGSASATIADSTGVMTIASSVLTTADINGGTIDNATIATSNITVGAGKTLDVSAGTLTLANDQISGDKVQGGTIGSTTITTLTSTTGNITNVNATTVDATNVEVTNLKAKDGTAAVVITDSTGVVTVSTQLNVDNLRLDGNAITSTNTNGNIALTPNGVGEVDISKVDIDSGTIDGTAIGGSTAAAGSFTTLNTSGAVVFNDAGADVDFRVEGDTEPNLLFVDASADAVSIGTTTPVVRLSGNSLTINDSGATSSGLEINVGGVSGGELFSNDASTVLNEVRSLPLIFRTANSERMRIDSSGRMLLNTTTVGAGAGGSTILSAVSLSGQDAVFIKGAGSAAGNLPLGIWNDAGSGENALLYFYTNNTIAFKGGIDFNRGANLIRYNTSSDATLKNIIGDSDGQKSVEILNSTRIREYAWKEDETQKPQIGVIAQELYETYKGAVSVGGDVEKQRDVTEEVEEEYIDEDGNTQTRTVTNVVGQETYTEYRPWGVDKTAFTFHLVAGWQAHEKIIKQQADMIAALEARITALEGQ